MPTAPIRLPDETDLSWCGWSLPVPADWRPLKIEGGWERGAMMVGDADGPVFKILWWRPEAEDFAASRWLAERWALSDDGTTWTFELRPDVTWHDGQPLTAEDVAFSYTYFGERAAECVGH